MSALKTVLNANAINLIPTTGDNMNPISIDVETYDLTSMIDSDKWIIDDTTRLKLYRFGNLVNLQIFNLYPRTDIPANGQLSLLSDGNTMPESVTPKIQFASLIGSGYYGICGLSIRTTGQLVVYCIIPSTVSGHQRLVTSCWYPLD